jgi:hypothetical protein
VTKVHSAPHPFPLENLRNILQAQGIAAEVRSPYLGAARGDIPATECWSELWVEDADAARARALIADVREPAAPSGDRWKCPRCGEEIEPQFDTCWSCGAPRPGGAR